MADTYDLTFVQGETLTRTFQATTNVTPLDFRDYNIRSQVRMDDTTTSTLLLDLTPHFTVSSNGDTLTLRVPRLVTAGLIPSRFKTAAWDLFLIDKTDLTESDQFLTGRAFCKHGVTDMVTP